MPRLFSGTLFLALALSSLGVRADAKVPSPDNCEIVLSGQSQGCQYRFGLEPSSGDVLIVAGTLIDGLLFPVPGCPVSVELVPNGETVDFCACCPTIAEGVTDPDGHFQVAFSAIGGYGSLDVVTHSHCVGLLLISVDTIEFTSQDLNASCEAASSTNLFDLARFGAALAPSYETYGDYDCSGAVNVFDLGFFANGLGVGCGQATCP